MLTIEQAEDLDAKAAKGLKFGIFYFSQFNQTKLIRMLLFLYFINPKSWQMYSFTDKTADKKSKEDTDEKKRKRSRAKSISGYRR